MEVVRKIIETPIVWQQQQQQQNKGRGSNVSLAGRAQETDDQSSCSC